MIDVIIIGSGISGCFLAKKLQEKNLNVLIIEKSKSLGGRFSTKPVGSGLADYGCQYISPKSEILKQLMEDLLRKKLINDIEIEKNKKVYICPYGLNKIPFYLSLGISSVTNLVKWDTPEIAQVPLHLGLKNVSFLSCFLSAAICIFKRCGRCIT